MSAYREPDRTVIVAESPEPNLLIRVLWFLFVGWWLSGLATFVAIVLQLTILGIPLAVFVINRMPQIVTLKSSRRLQIAIDDAGGTVVHHANRPQRSFWVRAAYYVLVGWWAVSLWLALAWLIAVTILGLPIESGSASARVSSGSALAPPLRRE